MAKIMNRERFEAISGTRTIKIGEVSYVLGREVTVDDYFNYNQIMFEHLSDEEISKVMSGQKDEEVKDLPFKKLMIIEHEKIKFIIELLSRGNSDKDDLFRISENVMANQQQAMREIDRVSKNMSPEEYDKKIAEANKKSEKTDLKN